MISNISLSHFKKLVFRSIILILSIIAYFKFDLKNNIVEMDEFSYVLIISIIWIVYIIEILLRFNPDSLNSIGSLKYLQKNYIPINEHNNIKDIT